MKNLPDKVFGIDHKKAYEEFLKNPDNSKQPKPLTTNQDSKLEGFIYVPSINLHIAKERSLLGKSWEQTIDEIYNKGIEIQGKRAQMPTPFQFMGYINGLLAENIPDLQDSERIRILNDILKTGKYRGAHLNARFIEGTGFNDLNIETATFDASGKLIRSSEPLETCLSSNCWADINSKNSQGLFASSHGSNYEQGKNVYFWKPVKGSVAWFGAGSGRAYLGCDRDSDYADAGLGVFLCAEGANAQKN